MAEGVLVSFWELLDRNEIVIPIIQRDYAQGRKGKEELRNRFLTSLHSALKGGEAIKLDFVYGGVENGQMMPLDGQQRLTTLWLLHWYVAFRAGKLREDSVRTKLKRFYYATRPSSTAFCRKLVDELGKIEPSVIKGPGGVVGFIADQHWYYRYYNTDPTIQAVLMMIKGDREPYGNKKEKPKNGLEQIFTDQYETMWDRLVSPDCPIRFFHKDLIGEDTPLVDDLYVKMNARGKQLTRFENFKAELIGYKLEDGTQYFDVVTNETDKAFVSNLDNDWIKVFWPYKHAEYNRVDEIYFKFINQFMLNYYLVQGTSGDMDQALIKLLSDGKEFNNIEDYSRVLDCGFKEGFLHTMNGLFRCAKDYAANHKLNDVFKEFGYYLTFNFIPQYDLEVQSEDQDNIPTDSIGQIPQVLFFAVCRYFEMLERGKKVYNSDKLKDWIRFCYNICYNPIVNTVPSMQAALKVIQEVSERYCLDIYGELAKMDEFPRLRSRAAEEQIREEFYKARFADMKAEMEAAERHAFFKGSIRFLLWNETGGYPDRIDSGVFRQKLANAKKYFSSADTLETKVGNKDDFCSYILNCTGIGELLSDDNNGDKCIRFNNSGEAWKAMLINESLCNATHYFLLGRDSTEESLREKLGDSCTNSDDMKRAGYVLDTILDKDFMMDLERLGDIVSGMLFLRRNGKWSLYPKNAKSERKVLVLGTSRNGILNKLSSNPDFSCDQHVGKLYYGWDTYFTYKKVNLIWKLDGEVRMMDHGGSAVSVPYDIKYDDFMDKVEKLVESAGLDQSVPSVNFA